MVGIYPNFPNVVFFKSFFSTKRLLIERYLSSYPGRIDGRADGPVDRHVVHHLIFYCKFAMQFTSSISVRTSFSSK